MRNKPEGVEFVSAEIPAELKLKLRVRSAETKKNQKIIIKEALEQYLAAS